MHFFRKKTDSCKPKKKHKHTEKMWFHRILNSRSTERKRQQKNERFREPIIICGSIRVCICGFWFNRLSNLTNFIGKNTHTTHQKCVYPYGEGEAPIILNLNIQNRYGFFTLHASRKPQRQNIITERICICISHKRTYDNTRHAVFYSGLRTTMKTNRKDARSHTHMHNNINVRKIWISCLC